MPRSSSHKTRLCVGKLSKLNYNENIVGSLDGCRVLASLCAFNINFQLLCDSECTRCGGTIILCLSFSISQFLCLSPLPSLYFRECRSEICPCFASLAEDQFKCILFSASFFLVARFIFAETLAIITECCFCSCRNLAWNWFTVDPVFVATTASERPQKVK